MKRCPIPPEGWYCTRKSGHEGPCAAWPAPAAASGFLDDILGRIYFGRRQEDVISITAAHDLLLAWHNQDVSEARKDGARAALEGVQEFVVAHAFDTTVGRKIDDYITERLKEAA